MTRTLIADLIHANAFELYGQPKWTFGKNTCNTYEVFAEKVHMPGGSVLPAQLFLELIEKDPDLTLSFSAWFIKAAITSAADLTEKSNAHVTLSVNLLPQFASHPFFVDQLVSLLEMTGFNPKKLQFEVSECQLLTQLGIDNLNRLHDDYGVRLYLANFGIGHANINLLSQVHFDGIELDRSFAAAIPADDQMLRIVCAIRNLADTLNLNVCAKGIETPEQFDFFDQLKVYKGQGYLIGKPVPMDELLEYIKLYAVQPTE